MTTVETTTASISSYAFGADTDEAEAAAAGFLARYTGRTLLAAGANPETVSDRLGHSSVAFMLDQYAHSLPSPQGAQAMQPAMGAQRAGGRR